MLSPTDACNMAIGELGGGEINSPRINSFHDGTSLSIECGIQYPGARDMVLELHPWNFCTAFTQLARHAETPVMKWRHMYHLPTQPYCLRVRQTNRDPGDRLEVGTDLEERRVLFSDADSVVIEYTKRVENLNNWSPLAIQVLVKVLASKLSKFLTGQNSLTELKLKEAQLLVPQAQNSDGREGTPPKLAPNTLLSFVRHAGSGVRWVEGPGWRPL